MNFLAHIYLSGTDPQVILGNFFADAVKGRKYKDYPQGIQRGILLHRAIDSFTDRHPTVRKSTARLHEHYGHYSGVIVDILYDHFLARYWDEFHPEKLESFVEEFYALLRANFEQLPNRFQRLMPYMVADNWLVKYATVEGIGVILAQMNKRTRERSGMDGAVAELSEHYEAFEGEFRSFFAELREFSAQKLESL